MAQEESGLDELLALSRKFTKQKEDNEKQERQRIEHGKKVKGVLQGLQDLNLQMALEQLRTVAKPEFVSQIAALKTNPNTDSLRKIITRLVDDTERQLTALTPKSDTAPLVNQLRTLSILLDLYFSLN
jgi:uncharacterized protein YktB (UPF0637 family)